jgi:hypothetical protein
MARRGKHRVLLKHGFVHAPSADGAWSILSVPISTLHESLSCSFKQGVEELLFCLGDGDDFCQPFNNLNRGMSFLIINYLVGKESPENSLDLRLLQIGALTWKFLAG